MSDTGRVVLDADEAVLIADELEAWIEHTRADAYQGEPDQAVRLEQILRDRLPDDYEPYANEPWKTNTDESGVNPMSSETSGHEI